MRLVYALQFQIAAPSGVKGASVPEMLKKDVAAWIRDWYQYWKKVDVSVPETSQFITPLQGHSIEVSYNNVAISNVIHHSVTWKYPAEQDDRLIWESRCEWASIGEDTEFSFLLRIASREFVIAPPQFNVHRPRIIRAIVKKYNCSSGGIALSALPIHVRVEDLSSFLEVLHSSHRRLPIVLFTDEPFSGKPLADPTLAQDKLVGLAHVYLLDKWACFALTDKLGKLHSCFGGAIRVYWPGFTPSSHPYDHPVLMQTRIEGIQAEGKRVSDVFLRQFAPASTIRFAYGPITRVAAAAVQAARQSEVEALRKEAAKAGDYDQLMKLADEEVAEYKKHNTELIRRVEELENELATAKENITALSIFREIEPLATTSNAQAETVISSVSDAVKVAARRFVDTLIFQKSAFDSADDSPYSQPDKVLQALEAMDDVCRTRRDALRRKQSIGLLEEAFSSRGFVYKAKCSSTSTGKWGEEYVTNYGGSRVSIEPHLALGKGGPDTCLRIHFFMDDDTGHFVVAHAGRHKTNTKT